MINPANAKVSSSYMPTPLDCFQGILNLKDVPIRTVSRKKEEMQVSAKKRAMVGPGGPSVPIYQTHDCMLLRPSPLPPNYAAYLKTR